MQRIGGIGVLFLAGSAALAQVDTGTIQGSVSDASGGVVPGAKVTITNEGTSFVQTAQTREDGDYMGEHWLATFALLALLAQDGTG